MSTPLNEQVQAAAGWIGKLRDRDRPASSSARSNWWTGCWSACWPTATSCSKACPAWPRPCRVRTLAAAIQASFHRIQFTPDLLPADIVGTLIYSPQDGKYHATKGPVFANFVLADEINRAPAKVQSALLETMQERQVTLGRRDDAAAVAVPGAGHGEPD